MVTVLVCTLANAATWVQRLEAEALHHRMQVFFALVLEEVERYGGTLQRVLEDGVLVLFGAPVAHEDHAQRAVLAALALQQRLHSSHPQQALAPEELVVRMGLHTGQIVIGRLGDDGQLTLTPVGDTTHLAVWLAQQALPGTILISDAMAHLVQGALRASQVQPLLVVENLYWIDTETQGVLDTLVESLPTACLLLLVTYCPEYQHGWGNKTSYTQLRLNPLPPASAEAVLQSLLGDDAGLEALKQCLIERTQGNPFFLEESVRTLVETHVLVGAQGAYRLARALPSIQVPATVQAVLVAPLPTRLHPATDLVPSLALVLITDPADGPVLTEPTLQQLFALTAAEAGVALALAAGRSAEAIAVERGVSLPKALNFCLRFSDTVWYTNL